MRKRKLWTAVTVLALLLAGGLSAQPAWANTYTVTTTSDSGPGSLRWAIEQANSNPGADIIAFNIPTSDPGYKPVVGVWTIQPLNPLPYLTDGGTTIDGTTQPGFSGAPIIEIARTEAGVMAGLRIESANNTIKGLVINRFIMQGILLYGSGALGNVISGNYIGTDATGASGLGTQGTGIQIAGGAHDNTIGGTAPEERNVVSGNDLNGVEISAAHDNLVIGNYIGTDASGMVAIGNGRSGVLINLGAQGNIIGGKASGEGNVISGNGSRGVYIYASGTVSNTVSGNYIGTDATGTAALGNQRDGIYIGEPTGGAQSNTIGPGNIIAYNGGNGIRVDGPDTIGNKITQNSIMDNANLGIDNYYGGNDELTPPTIISATDDFVSGTACPNCTVEIFSDPEGEGKTYEGTTTADGDGNFSWTGSVAGPYVTATATDASGNTSEFSCMVPLMSYVVINANDSGPGSLRSAIQQANANPGPDTIIFNIPPDDPGYNPATRAWTIRPLSPLPTISDSGTTIDATTQTASQGDTNPYGPEIELDGTNAGDSASGLVITSADNTIKRLVINRFGGGDSWRDGRGIRISGSSATGNVVIGCYIGTDVSGEVALGNVYGGVSIEDGASGNRIGGSTPAERNLIVGTTTDVNVVTGNGVSIGHVGDPEIDNNDNTVKGNYIGTNRDGTAALPNVSYGIVIYKGNRNVIENNLISGNGSHGLLIHASRSRDNVVQGNYIGTDASGQVNLGNAGDGVRVDDGGQNNVIGPNNVIAYNSGDGVAVWHDTTTGNTITRNSITQNTGRGIDDYDGGNTELAPPVITEATCGWVIGTAPSDSRVEFFSDPEDEGADYEGFTIADSAGNFTWTGGFRGPNLTATATDADGNTSEFSAPIASVCYRVYLPVVLKEMVG
jgi:titin